MNSGTQSTPSVPFKEPRAIGSVVVQKAFYRYTSWAKHIHEDFSINLICEGTVEAFIKGVNLKISPSTLLCVNPDETHAYHSRIDEGYRHDSLFIKPDVLQAFLPATRRPSLHFTKALVRSPQLVTLFAHLIEMINQEQLTELEYDCLLGEFFDALFAVQGMTLPDTEKNIAKNAVRKAKTFIKENYYREINLDDIVAELNLSKYYFQRLFKNSTSISVHRYLIALRVEKAKQALQRGESLVQTAYGCGFYDQSHLNRCFKMLIGMTPGRYRAFFH